ncbi:MAG: protein kinase domain-containing protein [Bryobacteraceae bacterium]
MPLFAGDKLGPYEILSPIGAGGMGQVWKARDTRLDRIVAIKTSAERFSERFDREARAIAALNHPHICQVYDVGPDYIVMEFVDGQEIQGPMALDLALKAAIQLASALEAAHRKSITHRDLKPANILNTKSGVKVLDFALAKFDGPQARGDKTLTRALTQEGTIVGTLQYMAPEQLQGKPADARSDIFSFGCVLYELLTGKRAFQAENQATQIAAILDREPEPIALHQPMIPPMLDRVVRKCLAKDPDRRWQTASDLKSELEWILESGSNAAMPAPVLEQRRRTARLGWLLAGTFAVLLGAFAFFHYRTAPAPVVTARFEIPLPEGAVWGTFDFPVLSPDASRILFGATRRGGVHSLWIRPIDSVHAQPVPGTDTELLLTGAAWSPDGRSIAYTADGELRTLDPSGNSPRRLGSRSAIYAPAWSPAGVILFNLHEAPFELLQIPAAGGEAKPAMPSSDLSFSPSFLPDGRHFLYCTSKAGGTIPDSLCIASLDAKEGKRLTTGSSGVFAPPAWLLYVRGSTLVAQSFDPDRQLLSGDPIPIADQVGVSETNGAKFLLAYRRAGPRHSTNSPGTIARARSWGPSANRPPTQIPRCPRMENVWPSAAWTRL